MKINLKLPPSILLLPASQGLLTSSDFEIMLANQKQAIRELDRHVSKLVITDHKLKQIDLCRDYANIIDGNLTRISDRLDDEIIAKTGEDISDIQRHQSECEKLITRLERIKKNITDDLSAKRFVSTREQINPVSVMNALSTYPLAAYTIGRIITGERSNIPYYIAAGASAVAMVASVPFQVINGFKRAGNEIYQTGNEIKNSFMFYYIKESARRNALALSVAVVLVTKRNYKIPMRTQEPVRRIVTARKAKL